MGTKISANADLITVETRENKGKQLKTSFSYIMIWAKMLIYFLFLSI